jgi:hypothetical protein
VSSPSARGSARTAVRALRARDYALLTLALAAGVVLLALHQSDRTGEPLSSLLKPSSLVDLVPTVLASDR